MSLISAPAVSDGSGPAQGDSPRQATSVAPPVEPAQAPSPAGSYSVQKGDTLWSVAQAHDLSVPELLALNNLSANHVLRSGETLKVRGADPTGSQLVASGGGAEKSADVPQRYTVQRGDTLYGISRRFKVSVGELSHWNGLSDSSPLLAGQHLVVYTNSGA